MFLQRFLVSVSTFYFRPLISDLFQVGFPSALYISSHHSKLNCISLVLAQSVENTQVLKRLGAAGYELSHFHKRETAKNHKETS